MTWYALNAPRCRLVAADLSAAGVRVERPVYTVDFWHPRHSVRVSRVHPLLPGYLLVGQALLPLGISRHWHSFMTGSSGEPLVVHDADSLLQRAARGEFDVVLGRHPRVEIGDRVVVTVLGLSGVVLRRVRRADYEVELDGGSTPRLCVPATGLTVRERASLGTNQAVAA
jgi:hypothetical protein